MRTTSIIALTLTLALPCMARGAAPGSLLGSFRFLGTIEFSPVLIYPPLAVDTWAFHVENIGLPNVRAFEFHFQGNFRQDGGLYAYQQTATLPTIFGFPVPETFFVTRPTIPNANVLIAPQTLVDTATEFKVAYTVPSPTSLLDTWENRAVMFFSVPVGESLNQWNLVVGRGVVDGRYVDITLSYPSLPEPAGLLLIGIAGLGLAVGTARRRPSRHERSCIQKLA